MQRSFVLDVIFHLCAGRSGDPERSAAEHQDSESSTALAACDSGSLEVVTMSDGFAPFVLLNGHAEVVHSFDCGFVV